MFRYSSWLIRRRHSDPDGHAHCTVYSASPHLDNLKMSMMSLASNAPGFIEDEAGVRFCETGVGSQTNWFV